MIEIEQVTGIILAGGRGSRMGGVDKGLQQHAGMPLVMHAILRLGPQVGSLMVNANRNLSAYESFGVPVWPDTTPEHPGPLAGFLVGLEHCDTAYLATVPCDTPGFPPDLVARLAEGLQAADAQVAYAVTEEDGKRQPHPVFCLMASDVLESLIRFLASGERKIDRWTAQHPCVEVLFEDASAFRNANTREELLALQPQRR